MPRESIVTEGLVVRQARAQDGAFMPNREYEIRASAPSQFSLKDLSRCSRIVRVGTAVDPDSAAVELPRSEILALAFAGNLITGVGAIKRRRPGYACQIAESSGDLSPQTLRARLRRRGSCRNGARGQEFGRVGVSQWPNREHPCREDLPYMSRRPTILSHHAERNASNHEGGG